jgi:hypothetical protein
MPTMRMAWMHGLDFRRKREAGGLSRFAVLELFAMLIKRIRKDSDFDPIAAPVDSTLTLCRHNHMLCHSRGMCIAPSALEIA